MPAGAAKEGLKIFTVGIGSAEGTLVTVKNAAGNTDYVRDEQGQVVKTKLNEPLLTRIAGDTGGFYLPLRGASTISQQTARTLFLLPVRSWVRKGAEAYLTVLVEFVWPKKRILEAYLNLVDFGHGNYGAEAAAQAYFRVPAAAMNPSQAARLASILPNPDKWKATRAGKRRLSRAFARTHEATENGMDWCVR